MNTYLLPITEHELVFLKASLDTHLEGSELLLEDHPNDQSTADYRDMIHAFLEKVEELEDNILE